MRSPNYPAIGLGVAIDLAQSVWNKEKRSYAPIGALVQAWGYSGLSGNARTKLAALRKYQLLEENDNGDMRLSDTAMHILHNPSESPERLGALREAALAPELFSELQQTYPQASNETLRSYLITRKGFTDNGANACIEAFRDTQEIARLGDLESNAIAIQPSVQHVASPQSASQKTTLQSSLPPTQDESTTMLRWPLPRGVIAEVRFVGPVKAAHIDILKQYLDVAKVAMALDEAENTAERAVSIRPSDFTDEPGN